MTSDCPALPAMVFQGQAYVCVRHGDGADHILDGQGCVLGQRIVKICELAFLWELTSLPSLALRLVCRLTITDTHRQYRRHRLRERGDGLETPAGTYHRDR